MPFNAGDWEENGETAQTYVDSYDVLPGISTDLDVDHWAQDDMQIIEHFLYDGILENEKLPANYVAKAQMIAEQRVLIGGLRLANLLKSLNLTEKRETFLS